MLSCFARELTPTVILREPEGRVEVLRRKQGAYSGIKAVCFLICIGRDAPFGAKPPQAGSHKSLMFLAESEELFYHKGCKFTYVGVDQTLRRPLAVLLFEIAVKGTTYPKTMGNFKKQNFDSAGFSCCGSRHIIAPRLLRSG